VLWFGGGRDLVLVFRRAGRFAVWLESLAGRVISARLCGRFDKLAFDCYA